MTVTTDTYEQHFLELAAKEPRLRWECPRCESCLADGWPRPLHCPDCQSRGWVPRPEPERLGALVEVAKIHRWDVYLVTDDRVILWHLGAEVGIGLAPKPWQALTEALRQATKVASVPSAWQEGDPAPPDASYLFQGA